MAQSADFTPFALPCDGKDRKQGRPPRGNAGPYGATSTLVVLVKVRPWLRRNRRSRTFHLFDPDGAVTSKVGEVAVAVETAKAAAGRGEL